MKLINYFERKVKGKMVPELEGLRFLAIVPVVIQHFVERWHRANPDNLSEFQKIVIEYCLGGGVGVFLFYSISGFILTMPFASRIVDNKPNPLGSLKLYFVRRLTRLEPPYIVIMLIVALSAYFLNKMTTNDILGYFFTGITYSTNLIYHDFNRLNPVIWSLEVEIQFYILAPFMAWLIFKVKQANHRTLLLLALIAFFIIMQQVTGISNGHNYLRYTILGQMQYFLIGILMVNFYLQHKLQPGSAQGMWSMAATIAIFSMIAFRWVDGYLKSFLFAALLMLLFIAAFRSDWFNRFMRQPWIMAIGGMCYTIYLVHLAIAQACIELVQKLNNTIQNGTVLFLLYAVIYTITLTIAVAAFYLLIERPCMDHSWPEKLKQYIKGKTKLAAASKNN